MPEDLELLRREVLDDGELVGRWGDSLLAKHGATQVIHGVDLEVRDGESSTSQELSERSSGSLAIRYRTLVGASVNGRRSFSPAASRRARLNAVLARTLEPR